MIQDKNNRNKRLWYRSKFYKREYTRGGTEYKVILTTKEGQEVKGDINIQQPQNGTPEVSKLTFLRFDIPASYGDDLCPVYAFESPSAFADASLRESSSSDNSPREERAFSTPP